MKLGDRVRPLGAGIARNHIGTVVQVVSAATCPTCGQGVASRVAVKWDSTGRTGEWHPRGLEIVNEEAQDGV